MQLNIWYYIFVILCLFSETIAEKMKFPLETVQIVLILVTIELVNAFQLTVLHTNDLHSRFDQVLQ